MHLIYNYKMGDDETPEQYFWRLCSAKNTGQISDTWDDLAAYFNEAFGMEFSESAWRKKFKKIEKRLTSTGETFTDFDDPFSEKTRDSLIEIEKQRLRIRDRANDIRRLLRTSARNDDFLDILREQIPVAEPVVFKRFSDTPQQKTCVVMLSDIHFGMTFNNAYAQYNSEIAKWRVGKYLVEVENLLDRENIDTCYVVLMGDLISGNIHTTVRLENRENLIQQITGVSELITAFLHDLSSHCASMHVFNVAGNHSRIEANVKESTRKERLDNLIPWYCQARLANNPAIVFESNPIDETFANFDLYGKTYVAVHGDLDNSLSESAFRIGTLLGKPIDYMLSAHVHVPNMKLEKTGIIVNGAVVTGGDEFTAKNRLFGPAYQCALIAGKNGVESIHPVRLDGYEGGGDFDGDAPGEE
jgi:predicted MPP superfamily phosphohydrolase